LDAIFGRLFWGEVQTTVMLMSVPEMENLLRALKIAAAECEREAEKATCLADSLEMIRDLADLMELRRRIEQELALQPAATSRGSEAIN
jgi:hypothetical protein